MKTQIIIKALFLSCCPLVFGIGINIPNHLLDCYRKNVTDVLDKLNIPMTIPILIDLLQKVELNKHLDMRLLSTATLYRMKYDGIQRSSDVMETINTVPVAPTSLHFNKFRLILTYLLSGEEELFPPHSLSRSEFCTLHLLLSSSVQAWARGDEHTTCPDIKSLPTGSPGKFVTEKQISVCPIERGVVQSNWGDVSAGHVLMAIAAALQNQDVTLMQIIDQFKEDDRSEYFNRTRNRKQNPNGKINNLWASTLAGDLAEIVLYQQLFVQKLIIGPAGVWNDSLVPRALYLPACNHWEMTLAETLGGMDGAIIASSIEEWTKKMGRLRLSQVLDMYYSRRGIHFAKEYRACQRKENIKKLLESLDLVQQTTSVTKLLQYTMHPMPGIVTIPDDEISTYAKTVVDTFIAHIDALTDVYSACEKGYEFHPVDIFTVIDGTWCEYDGLRLISALTHAVDVSLYGSRIGLINGHTGDWMSNVTHRIYKVFEDLSQENLQWPTSLSLADSLATITNYLTNQTRGECMTEYRSTRNTVILIISPNSLVNTLDLEKSQSLIKSIKSIKPSTSILYITSESTALSYEPLVKNEYMNDALIKSEISIEAIVEHIAEKLKDIPGQIIELHCDTDTLEYEDYVSPLMKIYEIPYKILQNVKGDITVMFTGHSNGNLSICGNDKAYPEHKLCQWIDEQSSNIEFTVKPLCRHEYACNVQFKVSLQSIKNLCTGNGSLLFFNETRVLFDGNERDDCRYPDQERITIRTSWSTGVLLKTNHIIIFVMLCITWITAKLTY